MLKSRKRIGDSASACKKAPWPCRVCKSIEYAALMYMICDRCIIKAAKQLQDALNMCHPEVGDIKIDLEHYPIEDHLDFYEIEWKDYDCKHECGGEKGVYVRKVTA